MRRRGFIALLGAMGASRFAEAQAQQPTMMSRVESR